MGKGTEGKKGEEEEEEKKGRKCMREEEEQLIVLQCCIERHYVFSYPSKEMARCRVTEGCRVVVLCWE